jgi:hypothetical protein
MIANVAGLVDLAALHDRAVAEDVAQRLADRLAPVDDEQHRVLDAKTPRHQIRQQLGHHGRVLGGARPDAERSLGPVDRDAERDEHRVTGELDAVDEHRDEVDVVELARDELRELLGRRVDERARGVALARAARLDRSSTGSRLRS